MYAARAKLSKAVSTHSRPKAAGTFYIVYFNQAFSFNTQPPEGGWTILTKITQVRCGFNTQPPEGGWHTVKERPRFPSGFNTQPPEGGWVSFHKNVAICSKFQHTAARRRLDSELPEMPDSPFGFNTQPPEGGWRALDGLPSMPISFNTQPPEGGWVCFQTAFSDMPVSTHSRPKAAGTADIMIGIFDTVSTHSRPKAAGGGVPDMREITGVSTHSRPKAAGVP